MPKKTFECAKTAGANLIVQVKKNQKSLLKQITHGAKVGNSLAKQIDEPQKHHGRLEERSYEVYSATEVLKHWPEWEHVQEIIVVSRKRTTLSRVSPPKIETELAIMCRTPRPKHPVMPSIFANIGLLRTSCIMLKM